MTYFRISNCLAALAMLGLVGGVVAAQAVAGDHTDDYVQGSHVHGLASLFVVLEGKQLQIELASPAMNLVGFEHAPHTEEQHQQVDSAQQQLAAAAQLFSFSGGQCQLLNADIDMEGLKIDHQGSEHEESHHDEADHEVDHESQHENEHDAHAEHEMSNESAAGHSDIAAKYLFSCRQPASLTAIDVTLFDHFPGVDELAAQWVVHSHQGGQTLSPAQSHIELQ